MFKKFWPVLLVLTILACAQLACVNDAQTNNVKLQNNNSYIDIDSNARNDGIPVPSATATKDCGFLGLGCESQKAIEKTQQDTQDFNNGAQQYRDNANPLGDGLGLGATLEHPGRVRECDISTNPPVCTWKDK